MEQLIEMIIITLKDAVASHSIVIGLGIGMSTIILESIIPILPLGLFIATNMILFGNIVGFFISWIATIIGCSISFFLFRKGFHHVHYKGNLAAIAKRIDKISFSTLVVLMSFPFSPAFLFNIAAGCSKLSYPKYLVALILSKSIIVYFWGFIGTTLVDSMTTPSVLWKLLGLLFGAFLLSKIAIRNFKLE